MQKISRKIYLNKISIYFSEITHNIFKMQCHILKITNSHRKTKSKKTFFFIINILLILGINNVLKDILVHFVS